MVFVPISFLKNNGAEWSGSGAATAIKVLAVPQHHGSSISRGRGGYIYIGHADGLTLHN
jgi:hypothetical protein